MANSEHLEILKSGVEVWNDWRRKNRVIIDLFEADLRGVNLKNADLRWANLENANLYDNDISGVTFYMSNLRNANLIKVKARELIIYRTNLFEIKLNEAHIRNSQIKDSDLTYGDLTNCLIVFSECYGSNFSRSILVKTDFHGSDLREVNFKSSILNQTNFAACNIGSTIFADSDLSSSLNLETVLVSSSCPMDFKTLSQSNLSKSFLLKIGLPENYINYLPEFFAVPGVNLFSTFLSHSSKDKEFAEKLYNALIDRGVQVWFDKKNLKPGDPLEEKISKGISLYDKTILICSEASLNSWWVERELDRVLAKEHMHYQSSQERKHVLIPIKIDNYIHSWTHHRKSDIERYKIGDFTQWLTEDSFQNNLKELIVALKVDREADGPISFL